MHTWRLHNVVSMEVSSPCQRINIFKCIVERDPMGLPHHSVCRTYRYVLPQFRILNFCNIKFEGQSQLIWYWRLPPIRIIIIFIWDYGGDGWRRYVNGEIHPEKFEYFPIGHIWSSKVEKWTNVTLISFRCVGCGCHYHTVDLNLVADTGICSARACMVARS
jgi:hypothetical protein